MARVGAKGRVASAAVVLTALCAAAGSPASAAGPNEKRVVGGVEADPADWPFAAALVTQGNQFCGGSVIARKAVLTAAHCVCRSDDKARRGTSRCALVGTNYRVVTERPDLTDQTSGQALRVKRHMVHPDYPRTFRHDFAVVRLREATDAPPVELASRSEDDAETGVGAPLTVAGWGSTTPQPPGTPSTLLRETRQNVIAKRPCKKAYRFFPASELICTRGEPISGGGRTSACFGDSGGPLVADLTTDPVLVGVAAFGGRRCGVKKPTVYTRVADGLRFIRAAAGL